MNSAFLRFSGRRLVSILLKASVMRNALRRSYYAFKKVPLMGKLVDRCAPYVKTLADVSARLTARRTTLSSRIKELEKSLVSVQGELFRMQALSPATAADYPPISIIINTCNRHAFLQNALESLRQQRYPHFEIICVNGPSTDGTDVLLSGWASRIKIRKCPERNLSLSRNIGIAAAAGEIVAFMDDDAVAPSNWLQELARGYADAETAAVGGFIRDNTGVSWQARICLCDRYGDVRHYADMAEACLREGCPEGWGGRQFLAPTGTNISFRRATLVELGGFDEHYAYHLDETDVLLRLADAGHRIVIREQAEILHKFAPSHQRKPDKTPVSLYHPARSKTYFVMRHALPRYGRAEAEQHLAAWLSFQEASARTAWKQGKMDQPTFARLREELVAGRADGEELARHPPAFAVFDRLPAPFKKMKSRIHNRSETIICPDYTHLPVTSCPNEIAAVQRRINRMKAEDCEVHIWRKDKNACLDFIDGVWIHSVSNFNKIIIE